MVNKIVHFLALEGDEQNVVGSISFDGTKLIPSGGIAKDILEERILDPETRKRFQAKENPERWLECLHYNFSGSYFRATAPEEE